MGNIVSLPLTVQLVNGNVADGGQVMTDLNQIASNINANGAANGVNSDITSLTALTSITTSITVSGWYLTNPIITGGTATGISLDSTTTAITQPTSTNTTQLATTAFVNQVAFSAALPAQPGGTATYFLSSANGTAAWKQNINTYQYITANGL